MADHSSLWLATFARLVMTILQGINLLNRFFVLLLLRAVDQSCQCCTADGSFIYDPGDGSAPVIIPADCCPTLVDTGEPANNFGISTPLHPAGQLVPVLHAAEDVWVGYSEIGLNIGIISPCSFKIIQVDP